jgi:hypothetical protein
MEETEINLEQIGEKIKDKILFSNPLKYIYLTVEEAIEFANWCCCFFFIFNYFIKIKLLKNK